MSTAGLASAVHVNFTIHPRYILLVVAFAIKLILSGLTAERQKGKLKEDLQRIEIYVKLYSDIVFTTRHSNFLRMVFLYIAGIQTIKYLWIFPMKSYGPSYFEIIFLFIIELPKTWMTLSLRKVFEKSVRLKEVCFILFSIIHLKERTIFRLQLPRRNKQGLIAVSKLKLITELST